MNNNLDDPIQGRTLIASFLDLCVCANKKLLTEQISLDQHFSNINHLVFLILILLIIIHHKKTIEHSLQENRQIVMVEKPWQKHTFSNTLLVYNFGRGKINQTIDKILNF